MQNFIFLQLRIVSRTYYLIYLFVYSILFYFIPTFFNFFYSIPFRIFFILLFHPFFYRYYTVSGFPIYKEKQPMSFQFGMIHPKPQKPYRSFVTVSLYNLPLRFLLQVSQYFQYKLAEVYEIIKGASITTVSFIFLFNSPKTSQRCII